MKKNLILLVVLFIGNISLSGEDESYYNTALNFYKNANITEALKSLEINSKSPNFSYRDFILLSHCYWDSGNVNKSIDSLYSALKLKPNDTEIYIELIKAHISSNRYKGALELIETAEAKFPNSKELKLQKAFITGKYGKINTALSIIETLKQESPNDPRPLAIESNLYFIQGDLEKAEMSIKWAISLQENSPFYYNNLALIYEKMSENDMKSGNKEKAKNNLMEADKTIQKAISLKLFPQMTETQKRIQDKLSHL